MKNTYRVIYKIAESDYTWDVELPAVNSGQAVLDLIKLEANETVTEIVNVYEI